MLTVIASTVREFIANTMLAWLRDPNAIHGVTEWTPRNIRDHILHMIPADDTSPIERHRIANGLARWMQEEDGFVAVRYQRDSAAVRSILRVIDVAVDTDGAESDEDIIDDETAWSYPRLTDWIGMVAADLRGIAREQKKLGIRPKKAYETLIRHAHGSILDAMTN